ncbi:hypothetical protein GCM10009819_17930 [Agromyces tropicus]|uniref:Uncharacterized protein n=1 Tax=Agromyces tropicus TaxID=555371 RepID=A0ABN2UCT2_9MICO
MDWTFWVGAIVIAVLVIVTQVFLHESRWSRREPEDEPRDEEPRDDGPDADDDGSPRP